MIETTQATIDRIDAMAAAFQAATGTRPGAYGGPAEERIATYAERSTLTAAGFRETNLKTLWIAPPSYGGRLLSVDEALEEIARVGALNNRRAGATAPRKPNKGI